MGGEKPKRTRGPSHPAPSRAKRDRLDPKHAKALDLRLRGASWRKIGAEMGVDHETVRRWSLSPRWQREADRRREQVEAAEAEERRALRAAAWTTIREVMEGGLPAERLAAAKTILDRTGAPAGATLDVAVSGALDLGRLKPEQLQAIAEGRLTLDAQGRLVPAESEGA